MRKKPAFTVAVLAAVFTAMLSAEVAGQQPDPIIEGLHARMNDFFDSVKSKKVKTAYDGLLRDGPLSTREDRKDLEDQTMLVADTYGALRGFEPVYTKRVGTDLIFAKYLCKCERFPLLWHVTFYYTSTGGELSTDSSRTWQVVSIRFDTDLELLTLLLRDE